MAKTHFLAWMQSELLPELPSNTLRLLIIWFVISINSITRLHKITSNLGNALNAVNQSYAIQADIIKAVHDMDIMKSG